MNKNGSKKRTGKWIVALAVIGIVAFALFANRSKETSGTKIQAQKEAFTHDDAETTYEIPRYTVSRTHSQRIQHKAYTVDYNAGWRLANWVAYSLTDKQTRGSVERYSHFEPDPQVKGARAQWWDYKNSSYDRGHLVPAGDMKWDETAMRECFYLSNICPQNHELNEGDWNYLENRVRGWANFFGKVYVVCGPIVSKYPATIGENRVAVPEYFYKVVLCNMRGEWKAVGFVFENNGVHHNLSHYCHTVDEVERITGIDFFPQLPDDVENLIEKEIDWEKWRIK